MKKLKIGMVGGGQGAFIGNVHRIAMRMTDRYELSAASFSSDPQRSVNSALELGVVAERSYASYQEMAAKEVKRDDGIDAVVIVTPNHLHFPIAKCFLEHGFHVICDKPLTLSSQQSRDLIALADRVGKRLLVTYNYTAYPMIREARERIKNGELGKIRFIQLEYTQDWLATALENTGQKQASWRTDPKQAGPTGCLGDIGVHASNLACFVTGMSPTSVAADLVSFVPGRNLDDHAQILLRYETGARGILLASQVAVGRENHLKLQVFGESGSIDWCQEQPNQLILDSLDGAKKILSRARVDLSLASREASIIPAGHPEGYLEAFAVLYREIAAHLLDGAADDTIPTASNALKDMEFIEACLRSSNLDTAWIDC